MSESIIVYKPGTVVSLGECPVLILETLLKSNNHISYRVVWWDGLDRQEEWVSSLEIDGEVPGNMFLGFREG